MPIEGGWQLLNHAKYRDMRDATVRREQNREAQERHRNKASAELLTVSRDQPGSAHTDTDTDTDTVKEGKGRRVYWRKYRVLAAKRQAHPPDAIR